MRKLFAGLMSFSVLICGTITIVSLAYRWSFMRAAVPTDGYIVEMREDRTDHGTSFSPVFTYRDRNGDEHKIYSTVGSFPPDYEVGQKVPIFFRPTGRWKRRSTISFRFGLCRSSWESSLFLTY